VPFRSDIIGPAILLSIEPNVITDPTSSNCHAENGRRERVALLLANNAGSLADYRRSLPSHSFSLFSPRHPPPHPHAQLLFYSLSLLLPLMRLVPTWSPRRRSAVFLSPYCVSQGCCLFCSSIVRIHQRIHSFRRYCLTAALARVRSVSPSTFLSIASVIMLRINDNLFVAKK